MTCSGVVLTSFPEIRDRLTAAHPSLVEALGAIVEQKQKRGSPPLTLHLARYPYGASIVDRGTFLTPCQDPGCDGCRMLREDCSYSHIPLGAIVSRSVEVSLDAERRALNGATVPSTTPIPLRILETGNLFGVFETLQTILREGDAKPPWSVSAGSRSIWTVAPLGDRRIADCIEKECSSSVEWTSDTPHWLLVQQATVKENWHVEVLFLGKAFVDKVQNREPGTDKLFELVLATGWRQSAALRSFGTIESRLRQQYLSGPAQTITSELGDIYLFATICHLFAISRGDAPAFEPAASAPQSHGPFAAFEQTLYRVLKTIKGQRSATNGRADIAYPVVLQPVHLQNSGQYGFYSFRCPTLPGLALPRVKNFSDLVTPIRRSLQMLVRDAGSAIDLQRTTYFTQSGKFALTAPDTGLKWEDFLKHLQDDKDLFRKERLYTDSPFLISGVRLVRQ